MVTSVFYFDGLLVPIGGKTKNKKDETKKYANDRISSAKFLNLVTLNIEIMKKYRK